MPYWSWILRGPSEWFILSIKRIIWKEWTGYVQLTCLDVVLIDLPFQYCLAAARGRRLQKLPGPELQWRGARQWSPVLPFCVRWLSSGAGCSWNQVYLGERSLIELCDTVMLATRLGHGSWLSSKELTNLEAWPLDRSLPACWKSGRFLVSIRCLGRYQSQHRTFGSLQSSFAGGCLRKTSRMAALICARPKVDQQCFHLIRFATVSGSDKKHSCWYHAPILESISRGRPRSLLLWHPDFAFHFPLAECCRLRRPQALKLSRTSINQKTATSSLQFELWTSVARPELTRLRLVASLDL